VKSVSWWSPDVLVSYSGPLWELQAVEVRSRPRVGGAAPALPAPEAAAFVDAGVDPVAFQSYLRDNDLALIVSRNVTTRDDADRQQPLNLRVPGGAETLYAAGTVYDVPYIQFFQGDFLRGDKGCCGTDPKPGRRVLARPLHEAAALACDPPSPTGPAGSKSIALDGSMAALVPAGRSLSWQLTGPAPAHEGIVRERYWLSFQPGEIRVCASCHGVNRLDQAGNPPPVNKPEALVALLRSWTACAPASPLLRSTKVAKIDPVTPALSTVLPLDPVADLYLPSFIPGSVDPDSTVLGDRLRPLVFYGVPGSRIVKLVKSGGSVRIVF
jgi:hypothetical protein